MGWARLPIGLLAAVMFAVGSYRVATTDDAPDGWGLMAVGLLFAGVWLCLEIQDHRRD
jgi:hypothetical protein